MGSGLRFLCVRCVRLPKHLFPPIGIYIYIHIWAYYFTYNMYAAFRNSHPQFPNNNRQNTCSNICTTHVLFSMHERYAAYVVHGQTGPLTILNVSEQEREWVSAHEQNENRIEVDHFLVRYLHTKKTPIYSFFVFNIHSHRTNYYASFNHRLLSMCSIERNRFLCANHRLTHSNGICCDVISNLFQIQYVKCVPSQIFQKLN